MTTAAGTERIGSVSPAVAVAVAGSVALLGSLDTALNIAFPDLTNDLGLEVSAVQWIVIAYVLTYTVLLVGAGRVADVFGHRIMLLWGLTISSAGFLANAIAPNFTVLLAARIGQGVGVAFMLAAAPALVTLSVPSFRRGRALGAFHLSAGVGLALGPVIGGVLVASFGWRSVFWFRLPVALLLVAVVWRLLPPVARRPGQAPVVDLAPFTRLGFLVANGLNVVANASMFAIWLLIPYYAIDVLDTGAVLGGVVLMVVPVSTAATAPLAGRLGDRFDPGRVTSIGLGIEGAGLLALARLDADTSVITASLTLATVGVGLSLFTVPNMSYVMGCLDREHQGMAAGTTQMARTAGVVIGVLVASAYFEARRGLHAERLGVELTGPISFVPALQDTFVVAAVVCIAAAAVSTLRALATGRSAVR